MKGLAPLVISLILFFGIQKFYIKNRGARPSLNCIDKIISLCYTDCCQLSAD